MHQDSGIFDFIELWLNATGSGRRWTTQLGSCGRMMLHGVVISHVEDFLMGGPWKGAGLWSLYETNEFVCSELLKVLGASKTEQIVAGMATT